MREPYVDISHPLRLAWAILPYEVIVVLFLYIIVLSEP
jgi:hypothetical protein